MTKCSGASANAETGSRPTGQAAVRLVATRFDPARSAALAKELGALRDFLKEGWDEVSADEARSSWNGGWGIEERLNASMFIGKRTTAAVYQALDKIIAAIAPEPGWDDVRASTKENKHGTDC